MRSAIVPYLKTLCRLRLGAITSCPNNRWSNPVTGYCSLGNYRSRGNEQYVVLLPLFLIFMRQLIRWRVTILSRNILATMEILHTLTGYARLRKSV